MHEQVIHITVFSSEQQRWRACALFEHLVVADKPTGWRRQGPRVRGRALLFVFCLQASQPQQNQINYSIKTQRPKMKVQIIVTYFRLLLFVIHNQRLLEALSQFKQVTTSTMPFLPGQEHPVACAVLKVGPLPSPQPWKLGISEQTTPTSINWQMCSALFLNNEKVSKGTDRQFHPLIHCQSPSQIYRHMVPPLFRQHVLLIWPRGGFTNRKRSASESGAPLGRKMQYSLDSRQPKKSKQQAADLISTKVG